MHGHIYITISGGDGRGHGTFQLLSDMHAGIELLQQCSTTLFQQCKV